MVALAGLGGFAYSGKDTVADHLATEYGWIKTYMSKPLETALLRVNPWVDVRENNWEPGTYSSFASNFKADPMFMRYSDLYEMVGYDPSKKCLDVRNYLQKLGTEVGRNMFGQNVWVDIGFAEVDRLNREGISVAITGMRFPNELFALRERGGMAIWVERPGYGPVNSHASDNILSKDDFDVCIHNVGGLEDLYNAVRIVVEALES
jgi:Deoxynucleotide monophosphate kinase